MILIGGIDPSYVYYNGTADPWNQAIGVFDMSSLQWKDSYNAGAKPYASPDVIKQYYSLR